MNILCIQEWNSGYLILNYIVSFFTKEYYVLSFIATLIPMWLFYKAFEYEADHVNLFLAIFLFGTTMYLYFFGITRLFIATGIAAYAYRYIFERNTKKYVLLILIAGMFHYSALFMMFFVYLTTETENKPRSLKSIIVIMFFFMPILIYILSNYFFPNMSNRYADYVTTNENIQFSILQLDKLPILLLALMFQGNIMKFNKNIRIYNILYSLTIIISIYSSFINIARIQWYVTFSLCIILPSLVRELKQPYKELSYFSLPFVIAYGIIYGNKLIAGTMIREYSNIFFSK